MPVFVEQGRATRFTSQKSGYLTKFPQNVADPENLQEPGVYGVGSHQQPDVNGF